MRGFPLLQVLAIAVLFALAGVPVWNLTRPPAARAVAVRAAATPAPVRQPFTVELHFAPAPLDFQLTYLGQPLLSGRGPAEDFSVPWTVQIPAEGADLALQARWPAQTPAAGDGSHAAVRLTVRFPDGHQADQTLWGEAASPMVEIVTIKP